MKVDAKAELLSPLAFVFIVLGGCIHVSIGTTDVYPIYPKKEQPEVSSLVEQDTQRIGRRLHAAAKTAIFGLQGNAYPDGIYYVTAVIGNPPKTYFLDVDTGSDLTWLQCDAPCQRCSKTPHEWYKPQQRSFVSCMDPLCAPVQAVSHGKYECGSSFEHCYYDIKYADNGFSMGVLVRDSVVLKLTNGTAVRPSYVFGCGYIQGGSLKQTQTTDGVLGLSSGTASLTSQWEKQGLIKNVIGICIAGGGKKGGYMFFGDDLVPTSSMTWVPLLGRPPMKYYHVGAAQIIFGNKLLTKDGDERRLGGIIFDTGSSYTYFTKQAYNALVSAVKESFGKHLVQDSSDLTLPLCWKGNKKFRSIADAKSYFKPLKFHFKGTSRFARTAKLEITPEGYLVISVKGNVCLGILDGTQISSYNVIGDISLQGFLMVYDNGNNRIGWTRMDCSKFPKSSQRRWALEDTQKLPEGETIQFAQDLGKGVCPATSYFAPDLCTLPATRLLANGTNHCQCVQQY